MSESVMRDAAQLVLDMNLGLSPNELFVGVEPDQETDPAVTIDVYGSEAPEHTQDKVRPAVEIPRFQINVRSMDFQKAEDLANRMYALMWDYGRRIGGTQYINFQPLSIPAELPGSPDANGRWTLAFRARARRKPA